MQQFRRKILALLVVSASYMLVGCGVEGAIGNFGKSIGDALKGIKMP
jgi:hypothetical protein